ncbi:alpha/beta fold hydrolase [Ruegeria arenilitoris]|uniref:alpha/beta fold hydrolase n=1 Tax=Ruegeria arenilitoris TaxID=1173585 RepID=UPI00147D3FB6|nr:alpha/beta hydrolase [Ruegeria arenilitoris]
MPVIRINAIGNTFALHRSPRSPLGTLQQTHDTQGPVIIMTHGYKYRPDDAKACPHRHILSLHPTPMPRHCPSWPQQLGFGSGFDDEGLGIAFGWNAQGPLWAVRRRAVEAGRALAELIRELRHMYPKRPIHFIGHSMGTELALEALYHVAPGSLNRIISMSGAVYQSRTLGALDTPAGKMAEFINVTSRENDLFDFLYEWMIQPPQRGDRSIGVGFQAPNAVTLQLDCTHTLDHLSRTIFPVGAPQSRICHWSSYTRPGILRVYNALLRNEDRLSLPLLRNGIPKASSRRWSRLFALPRPNGLLPFAQKAS